LRLEIGRRLAVFVGADLAGDEQIFGSFHARDVRIRRERLGHGVGIETLDGRHGRLETPIEEDLQESDCFETVSKFLVA